MEGRHHSEDRQDFDAELKPIQYDGLRSPQATADSRLQRPSVNHFHRMINPIFVINLNPCMIQLNIDSNSLVLRWTIWTFRLLYHILITPFVLMMTMMTIWLTCTPLPPKILLHWTICKDRRITLTLMSLEVDQVSCSWAMPFSFSCCVSFSKSNYTYLV